MKRKLATSLCTFALLTSLQPAAQADELADFLRSLVGPIMPGNNEGPAPANPGPGDALIAEVSGQHFSAQAPQLDPAVQPQWASSYSAPRWTRMVAFRKHFPAAWKKHWS